MSTREQLQAENERLGAEVAALRSLLIAVRGYAKVPHAASIDDLDRAAREAERRIDAIAIWADPDTEEFLTHKYHVDVLHDRANALRADGARAVRYKVKGAEPEPEAPADATVVRVVMPSPVHSPEDEEPVCGCSHRIGLHDEESQLHECTVPGCGCTRWHTAARKTAPEPPRVVPGAVEHEPQAVTA